MAGRNLLAAPEQQVEQVTEVTQVGRNLIQPVQPVQQAPIQQDPSLMEGFRQKGEEFGTVIADNNQQSLLGMIGETPEQQIGVAAAIKSRFPVLGTIAEKFLGLGSRTTETETTPELKDAGMAELGPEIAFNLAMNFDTDEIEGVVKKHLPEAPIRKDKLGNTFVTINDKEFILNRPGFSAQDRQTALNDFVAFLPSSRLAAIAPTVLGKLGLGALGASGTQAIIEGGQVATGGEFDAADVAVAGVGGALGEAPAAVMASKRLSPTARELLPDVTEADAATATQFKDQTGVSLLPSQVSESQKDQLVGFLLFQDPKTSKRFGTRLKDQSKETFNGLTSFLDELATTDDAARAALDVRNISKKVIDDAVVDRTRQTAPLFKEAHKNATANQVILDTGDIISRLQSTAGKQVAGVKGQIEKLISIVREGSKGTKPKRMISGVLSSQGKAPKNGVNSETLQNAKKEIDRFIKKESADRNINDFTIGVFKDTKDSINTLLIDNVEGFKEANDLFIDLSPSVDALKQGVGDISKISENKLAQVSKQIFNLDEFIANPQGFMDVKQTINNLNPEAWTALTRSRFQQDLAEVGVDSLEDALDPNVNVIQQLWSKSFRGKEKTLFKNALDGDLKKNYLAMSEVFNRTRKRPAQSATEQLQELRASLDGKRNVAKAVDAMINPNSAGMFEKVFGSPQIREKNTQILADIITDPQWMDRMSEIRRLGMNTPAGGAAFVNLFREALNQQEPEQ